MLYPARFMLVGAMNPCPCAMQATRQSHAPVIQGQFKDTAEGFPDRSSIASSCTWHFSAFCRFSLPLLLPLLVAASIAVLQSKTIHAIPLLD
jgi:hypothetical protein